MSSDAPSSSPTETSYSHLAISYWGAGLVYLGVVWMLWQVGVEALYAHPTPFYALYQPSFSAFRVLYPAVPVVLFGGWLVHVSATATSLPLRRIEGVGALALLSVAALVALSVNREDSGRHLVALSVMMFGIGAFVIFLRKAGWPEVALSGRAERGLVLAMVAFSFVLCGSVAMLRGGSDGISQAYERQGLEYVSDIGIGGSIRGLFEDYEEVHPYLSMHAKVHPPGPIVILWLLSYVFGREPMGLAFGTMAFGALAIIPFYAFVKDMLGRRTALTSAALYVFVPSIVLFTATSADITFMPITLTTLFLFWRAVHRSSVVYGVAAGVGYAFMSLTSFSLIVIGIFFGLVGLLRLTSAETRVGVIKTAITMAASCFAVHVFVWYWSDFDVISVFELSRVQFDEDQEMLDIFSPRSPAWMWRILNPACWVFFAGIPVSVLLWWRLRRPEQGTKGLFLVFALTLVVLDILYLARGEGERSAMYVFPFMVVPAGHYLDQLCRDTKSLYPFAFTLFCMGIQTWLMETFLYTYW